MGHRIILDGDKSRPPFVVVVDDNKQTWFEGQYVAEKDDLPEQKWPEPEKQSTGMSWMDKLIDWLP